MRPTLAAIPLVCCIFTLLGIAQSPELDATKSELTIQQWIQQLDHPDYRLRERATEALWRRGAEAELALRQILRDGSTEASERARTILDRFEAGHYPDTSPEVLQLLGELNSNDYRKVLPAMQKLVRLHRPAIPSLKARLRRGLGIDVNRVLFDDIAPTINEEVFKLMQLESDEEVLELLSLSTFSRSSQGIQNHVHELKRQGKLKQGLQELDLRTGSDETRFTARLSKVFVLQALGDHEEAIQLAQELEMKEPTLQFVADGLLEHAGAWGRLAQRPMPSPYTVEGLKAFRLRQAGKIEEANALLDPLLKAPLALNQNAGNQIVDPSSLALLMNDRLSDALQRMKQTKNATHILADILAAKMDYQQALTMLDTLDRPQRLRSTDDSPLIELRRARLLHLTGQRDQAKAAFDAVAQLDDLSDGYRNYILTQLIRTEVRCGLYVEAALHLGKILLRGVDHRITGQSPFEVLFGNDSDSAKILWDTIANQQDRTPETMVTVLQLLRGEASLAELHQAEQRLRSASQAKSGQPLLAHAQAHAVVLLMAGRAEEAFAVLQKAAERLPDPDRLATASAQADSTSNRAWVFGTDETYRFWLELADVAHNLKKDRQALPYLEQALRHHPAQPILLYLQSRCLREAGDTVSADRVLNLSHRAPLGNARLRGRYLEELLNRGVSTEAKAEVEAILQSAWLMESFMGNVWNQVGRAAVRDKDYVLARTAYSKAIHYLLCTPGVAYVEGTGYFSVPMYLKQYDALAKLANRQTDQAIRCAESILSEAPGTVELIITMVPELERQGQADAAQRLFDRSWNFLQSVLEQYPECDHAKATAAWLAAGCQRNLEVALRLSTEAVASEPQSRFFRETLAEVSFRNNQRQQAVGIIQKLMREDRHNRSYARQLERYRHAPITAPLLEGDD